MPEDVQTYAARVPAAADPDGRLSIDIHGVVGRDIFPFEVGGLRLKPGPTLMPELRGSFLVVWDDVLPPVPVEVRDANAAFVVERLIADLGGRAVRG